MTWVKCHDELRKGAKRGLSRATRFVYLELCLEARPLRGVVRLPARVKTLDAVHDLLGGDRKEIAKALEELAAEGMIEVGTEALTLPSWEAWNRVDASAERTRAYRARRRGPASDASPVVTVTRHGDERDARVTAQDQRREDQIPPTPKGGSAHAGDPEPDQSPEVPVGGPSPAAARAALRMPIRLANAQAEPPRDRQTELEKFYQAFPDARPTGSGGDDR